MTCHMLDICQNYINKYDCKYEYVNNASARAW